MNDDLHESHIPPPTFDFLVLSLKMQAEMALGLVKIPGENGPDLARARHIIDLLGMLGEKTKGNLSLSEQRLIENSLTELRFRFVQTKPTDAAPAPPIEDPEPVTND